MAIDTINNFGLPFSGNFLISVNIGDIQIFPQTEDTFKGGQTILKGIKITESMFSPIVQGNIMLLDIDTKDGILSSRIKPFMKIVIQFNPNIGSETNTPVTFTGIITQSDIMTDDAVNSTDMNNEQKTRIFQLDFMNKDIFIANLKTPWKIPDNDNGQNDFVGWIADDGSRPK
jgi:hypothetical protein